MKALARLLLLTVLCLLLTTSAFANAQIVVINFDGANEGFNDPTPASPVGGNSGTTLGQQRINAYLYAATIWGQKIDSNVTIYIGARFDPLAAGVLGQAGAGDRFADFTGVGPFPGAEFPGTWYQAALADKRAGYDIDPFYVDISTQFSSNFNFYLGLDGNHGPLNDLVSVLLHEFAHGLGFANFVNEATGANGGGFTDGNTGRFYPVLPDIYSRYTLDTTTSKTWNQMTNAERQASAVRFGRVVWNGPEVSAGVPSVLSFGSPEVRVLSPASIAGAYQFGTASFGPPIGSPNVSGTVLAAVDVAEVGGTTTDGCSPFSNGAAMAGKIALVERGLCGFAVKARNAAAAGAAAVIIYNNSANAAAAPPGMAFDNLGAVTIPAVSLTRNDGLLVLGQPGATASIGVDMSVRAGTDAGGRVRLYMPFPVALGSSASHFDTVASRNLLMEPFISADLTQSVEPPEDLTLPLLRDIGWFPDADVEGVEDSSDNCPNTANADQANYDSDSQGDACDADDDNDGVDDVDDAIPFSDISATVTIGGCDSGASNPAFASGKTLMDLITAILASSTNHGQRVSEITKLVNDARDLGLITTAERNAIHACAAQK